MTNRDDSPSPKLRAILADMLAYEAAAFDGAWYAYEGTVRFGPFPTEADAYVNAMGRRTVEFQEDGEVNGGDLVEAFAKWRVQLKEALAAEGGGVQDFHAVANFANRHGNFDCWSATIQASSMEEAREKAMAQFRARHKTATKVDLTVRA